MLKEMNKVKEQSKVKAKPQKMPASPVSALKSKPATGKKPGKVPSSSKVRGPGPFSQEPLREKRESKKPNFYGDFYVQER